MRYTFVGLLLVLLGVAIALRNTGVLAGPWLAPAVLIVCGVLVLGFPREWEQWRRERRERRQGKDNA